jgi:hypothetical protein
MMSRGTRKREKKMYNTLQFMAGGYATKIAECDYGLEFAIGMASNKQYVFFYKEVNERVTEHSVSLEDIRKCSLFSVNKTVKTKDGIENVIEKLELVFEPKDNTHQTVRFEFYTSADHFMLSGELQLIKKWEAMINPCLSTRLAHKSY